MENKLRASDVVFLRKEWVDPMSLERIIVVPSKKGQFTHELILFLLVHTHSVQEVLNIANCHIL